VNKEELIQFEEEIKDLFLEGKIRAPIHLSVGSEDALIKIFKKIRIQDWVLSTHRNHYHALLRGIPREGVKKQILEGKSMHIRGHRFITSSIVGGCLPIAVGLAMAIKRLGKDENVYVFIGDMAAYTGIAHECFKYGSDLPLYIVIEDNGFSVNTPTHEIWKDGDSKGWSYRYEREYPHAGVGKWVTF
jgi:pyruvate dehydrogenase E1 component alpha subunit